MSGVNFLEKLLDGIGVEWKPLGNLSELVRGNGLPEAGKAEANSKPGICSHE